jgi:oxygen-dependent protoporphyrinogen oxidase
VIGDRGSGIGDRGSGTGDRGSGTGDRGPGIGDRGVKLPQITIVGAGITGLAAAYELYKRGLTPVVLEAAPRPGGLIRTDRVDGFTIEAGPDSVLATKPAALELANELGLGDRIQQVRTAGAFVLRGRRLYRLPSPSLLGIPLTWRGLLAYDLLPWHARLRLARGVLWPAGDRTPSDGDISVAAFFRSRFGAETVDLIAQPLLGGIHAGDIEQLSMASLFPRLLTEGVRRPSKPGRSGDRADRQSPFASLRGGMATLVEALEGHLPAGTVRYDARVDRIPNAPVILAAPAYAVATLLEPIDPETAALCARVPYVSTASVALVWRRRDVPHSLDGTGFVVARRHSDVRITACTWVSSKWADRAPGDTALLRVFIGGAHDPHAVDLDDEAIIGIARHDLNRVLGIAAEPALTRVYRWRRAGAQHTVGHLQRVARIEERLAPLGIFVAGSGFRSVGIPDCVADARRAALAAAEYQLRI